MEKLISDRQVACGYVIPAARRLVGCGAHFAANHDADVTPPACTARRVRVAQLATRVRPTLIEGWVEGGGRGEESYYDCLEKMVLCAT